METALQKPQRLENPTPNKAFNLIGNLLRQLLFTNPRESLSEEFSEEYQKQKEFIDKYMQFLNISELSLLRDSEETLVSTGINPVEMIYNALTATEGFKGLLNDYPDIIYNDKSEIERKIKKKISTSESLISDLLGRSGVQLQDDEIKFLLEFTTNRLKQDDEVERFSVKTDSPYSEEAEETDFITFHLANEDLITSNESFLYLTKLLKRSRFINLIDAFTVFTNVRNRLNKLQQADEALRLTHTPFKRERRIEPNNQLFISL